MPPVVRLGDIGSGHGSFPPTNTNSASTTTILEGRGVHRKGDTLVPHGSPSPSPVHGRTTSSGSPYAMLEGKPIARLADSIGCGGILVTGSSTTIMDSGI